MRINCLFLLLFYIFIPQIRGLFYALGNSCYVQFMMGLFIFTGAIFGVSFILSSPG